MADSRATMYHEVKMDLTTSPSAPIQEKGRSSLTSLPCARRDGLVQVIGLLETLVFGLVFNIGISFIFGHDSSCEYRNSVRGQRRKRKEKDV